MDNQYTPTYHRLWNREFSLLIAAESLLCIACYMTIPFLPYRLYTSHYIGSQWANLTMVMFVAGIFLSGFFVSWLIQRYRRNKVFFTSVLALAGIILAMTMFDNPKRQLATQDDIISLMAACLVGGMAFGNAKRVLSCTLLIDKTESRHRTEANYAAIWIARMAIVLGPIASIILRPEVDNMWFYGIGAVAALLAGIIVMSVKFPFRAPEEGTHFISIDRFFLPQGWNVAIVVALMSTALGVVMSTHTDTEFFSSLAVGFVIALVILRFQVVRIGRYTSAIGNLCILAAVVAMNLHNGLLDSTLKPMMMGLGFGLTSSEQLYKLLGRCNHCQRSTAESTYFLASDGGLFIGIALGWSGNWSCDASAAYGEQIAIALFAIATAMCCVNAILKKRNAEYHAQ